MLLCEAAAYYKEKGLTLWEQMINIYIKYGYYKEGIVSVTLEGVDGAEKIKEIMKEFRKNPPTKLGNYEVIKIRDYETSILTDCKTDKTEKIELPQSNVLYYELENDGWCCVRPSGTEPKIKYYIGVKGNSIEDANNKMQEIEDAMKNR